MLSAVVICVMFILFSKCAARIQEPSCTYMDNLEKLLEKNVRNEHKLSVFGDALVEWETKLEAKLKDLDKAETNRNKQIEDMQKTVENMKQRTSEAVDNLQKETDNMENRLGTKEAEISQTLEDALQKHEEALKDVQEAFKTPVVVFTAKDVSNKDVTEGKVIKFTTIVNNVGGAYDTGTGYFTAPYDGLYLFHTTVCADFKKGLYVHLMAAGTAIGSTYHYNGDSTGTCTSISGMAAISKGDNAWVQGASTRSGALFGNIYRWPTFTGVLIHV